MNKKIFLITLFVMLVVVNKQVCYASAGEDNKGTDDKKAVTVYGEGVRKTPIGNTEATIATYIPEYQQDKEGSLIVLMRGINDPLAPNDLQHIGFKIENPSKLKTFTVSDIYTSQLFVNDDLQVSHNDCRTLEPTESCTVIMDGSVKPQNELSKDTYVTIYYKDSLGTSERLDVRPWSPIVLYPQSIDFSLKQPLKLINIYPNNIEILSIKEVQEGDGKKVQSIVNSCGALKPDQECKLDILPYTGDTLANFRKLTIKYKIKYTVQEEDFAIRSVLFNPDTYAKKVDDDDTYGNADKSYDEVATDNWNFGSNYWVWGGSLCGTALAVVGGVVYYYFAPNNNRNLPAGNGGPGAQGLMAAAAALGAGLPQGVNNAMFNMQPPQQHIDRALPAGGSQADRLAALEAERFLHRDRQQLLAPTIDQQAAARAEEARREEEARRAEEVRQAAARAEEARRVEEARIAAARAEEARREE